MTDVVTFGGTTQPHPSWSSPRPPEPLLSVSGLRVGFTAPDGSETTVAVDGVDLAIGAGRTLGLVGESGSGKSITCLSILRLLPERGHILSGRIRFAGRDLGDLSQKEMQDLRGGDVAMIFQDPMSSLNPVKRVGWQIAEALHLHETLSMSAAQGRAVDLLRQVGIPDPASRARSFPHQLSGGMCQRVMIAMALACKPRLLIADEPTTALDVTIQAQILDLLRRLAEETGTAVILVTHDLAVVAETADDVAVMYAGRVVETGPVEQIFAAPRHPYTHGLLGSLPSRASGSRRLPLIEGSVPAPKDYPPGCRFAPRCARASDSCRRTSPALSATDGAAGAVACHHPMSGDVS
ncbi:MAG: ABC transporter ATP-binding protein [Thalassobaculaceae bacterium]|nr:ABC transporter ATP-binding protein [Thalassobaculaceae bacterium]